jgi:hypothetical protein
MSGLKPHTSNTQDITRRAHRHLAKVKPFYFTNHAIIFEHWLLFECCFAFVMSFLGFIEGEGTLKSCQSNLPKNIYMANPKFKNVHLPPLHDEDETSSRMTLFEGGGDDIAQPTVIALSSTTSSMRGLKDDIMEAWKRRKKKPKESRYQHRLPHRPTQSCTLGATPDQPGINTDAYRTTHSAGSLSASGASTGLHRPTQYRNRYIGSNTDLSGPRVGSNDLKPEPLQPVCFDWV